MVFIDSAMEMLRQEIIGQEHIFRTQVRELHRLYWTQKNMMVEHRINGINAHVLKGKVAFPEPSLLRKEGYALDGNVSNLLRNHPKFLNLRLPAYGFILGADAELSKSSNTFQTDCGIEGIDLEDAMTVEHCKSEACAPGFRTLALDLFGTQSSMMENRVDDSSLAAASNDPSCSQCGSKSGLIDLNIPIPNEDEFYPIISPSMNLPIDDHQILKPELRKSYADESSFTSANPASVTSCKSRAEWLFPLNQESTLAHNNTMDCSANAAGVVSTEEDIINFPPIISINSTKMPRNHDDNSKVTLSIHYSPQGEALCDEFSRKFCAEYSSNGVVHSSDCSSYEKCSEGPATLSTTDDSIITQLRSPIHEISYVRKSNSEERDEAIAEAAEALMTITSGRSGLLEKNYRETKSQCEEPQNSSDSFEFMAMQLCEAQNEETTLMDATSNFNETRKDDTGIRLRRGRRLRDFRKEILPGLVSLSRHEICEDLYNIGYTLRKNMPKTARGNWFLPVRNRRSRMYLRR